MTIRIKTLSRLHLGFMDLNGNLGRRFGSIGVSLSDPYTEISVKKHSHLVIHNANDRLEKRISTYVNIFSKHYKTGEPLPGAMLDKLIEAKNFQAGLGMLRQLEFSIFDFELHQQNNINSKEDIQTFINKNREEIAVIMPPEFNRFQHSFSHIFAGGYAAGYYSYKWAEVLSCDAFARFEEEGIFNSETASDFLNHILSQGGSDEAMNLFKRFRGREPEVGHLLRHSGLE